MLRAAYRKELDIESQEYIDAISSIEEFRASFENPLSSLVIELEELELVKSNKIPVANRSKQINRIALKLILQPQMRLSQMDDLGGCRLVVLEATTVELIAQTIRSKFKVRSESDYRENARSSGYRALHLIVDYSGCKIEIQLRTRKQHSWAELVETLDKKYGLQLKDESGPEVLRTWLKSTSLAFHAADQKQELTTVQKNELTVNLNAAVQWMTEVDNEAN